MKNILAIDISEVLVKKTLERVANVTGMVADVHHLPLRQDVADHVFAIDTIEHWSNPYLGVLEISRVSKMNGTVVISTPSYFFRVMQKLKLFDFGEPSQPIDLPVHPEIFRKLYSARMVRQVAYISDGVPFPLILALGIVRAARITTAARLRPRRNQRYDFKSLVYERRRFILRQSDFPMVVFLLLCSSLTLLLEARK